MIGFVLNSRWDDYRRATLVSWLHLSFIVVVIIVVDVSISHRRQFVKIWLFNASLMTLQLKLMKHMQGLHLLKEIWMNIINLKHNWKNFMIYYLPRVPRSEYYVLHKKHSKVHASMWRAHYSGITLTPPPMRTSLPALPLIQQQQNQQHIHNRHHSRVSFSTRRYESPMHMHHQRPPPSPLSTSVKRRHDYAAHHHRIVFNGKKSIRYTIGSFCIIIIVISTFSFIIIITFIQIETNTTHAVTTITTLYFFKNN